MPVRRLAVLLALFATPAAGQDPANPSFYLVNDGKVAVSSVFATPSGTRIWGDDRLATPPLRPRRYAAIRLPSGSDCLYDLRVVYANGRADERRAVDVCAVDSIALPSFRLTLTASVEPRDPDPSFILVNRGRTPILRVFLSLVSDDAWGADRLGAEMIERGVARAIRVPRGGCVYDVRVIFEDGRISERRGLNLCETIDLTVP